VGSEGVRAGMAKVFNKEMPDHRPSDRPGFESPQPLSAVDRVWIILEEFAPERPSMTLSEISTRTGIPLTTTHRTLSHLVRWGALERDREGRYRIGLKLWEIGALAPRSRDLREAAMPFLEDLYEISHQNVQLAVIDGFEAVYIERISGHDAVSVISRPGGRLPLHATGVGLVLLAYAPRATQEQILASPLKTYTPRTISTPTQLEQALAYVRERGFVISSGQIDLSALSIAAPVFGQKDEVVAALSVALAIEDADPNTLVPVVRAAARGVSRALGSARARRLSGDAQRT